jgi:SAM-dependent methyltransferase
MTDVPELYGERERAESFGSVAEAYDRFRPAYPEELIDQLLAREPSGVLDIGCGTGKAARALIARGLDVLGVELHPEMAAIARRHGVPVEVASFEEWDDRGRTFDLAISGQAWHWIDPAIGAPKLRRLLRPAGVACFFWNYDDLDVETKATVDSVYRRLAPSLLDLEHSANDGWHEKALAKTGAFSSVESAHLTWTEELAVTDWIGRISTYSKLLTLGAHRLAAVQDALREALGPTGRPVRLTGGTYLVWARP